MTAENRRHHHNPNNIPDWARRERGHDMEWIGENFDIFWSAATFAFEKHGRGAISVDTTSQPVPGMGHPLAYVPQEVVDRRDEEDTKRMVREYDPTQEFVVVLLKPERRTSTYRVQVRPHEQSGGK